MAATYLRKNIVFDEDNLIIVYIGDKDTVKIIEKVIK